MNKKVANKGYTLEISSVEGIKNKIKTIKYTVETKEEALLLKKLALNLFSNCNDNEYGIGNIPDHESDIAELRIVKYLIKNPEILEFNNIQFLPEDLENQIKIFFIEENIEDNWTDYLEEYFLDNDENADSVQDWINLIIDYNKNLLGDSEQYFSKVCKEVSIYYSDKDLFITQID